MSLSLKCISNRQHDLDLFSYFHPVLQSLQLKFLVHYYLKIDVGFTFCFAICFLNNLLNFYFLTFLHCLLSCRYVLHLYTSSVHLFCFCCFTVIFLTYFLSGCSMITICILICLINTNLMPVKYRNYALCSCIFSMFLGSYCYIYVISPNVQFIIFVSCNFIYFKLVETEENHLYHQICVGTVIYVCYIYIFTLIFF